MRKQSAGSSFLNSTLVDRYFRITNGNTQVNATELRKLPLPPLEQLIRIGQQVETLQVEQDFDKTERIVMEELGKDLIVGSEEDDLQLPILQEFQDIYGQNSGAAYFARTWTSPGTTERD